MLTKRGEGLTRRDFIKIAGSAVEMFGLPGAFAPALAHRNVPDKGGSPST